MAATDRDDEVYATLLLSDTYLPGALVLAHSLLDNGATRKLAVLVTEDTVSREAIAQLQTVYHHVIPVSRIRNGRPENLELMNRVDLHSAFTKIALWKQTQFSRIVYIDADIVAYRAPDELFDIEAPFSAAPDIGWPDIFNSGVMVLRPDLAEYDRMLAMAEGSVSFDGADQGLLNMHFGSDYNRISFTYNVTPSAHYQYLPAFRHFQSSINMVHFIGPQKPWFQGRSPLTSAGDGNDAQADSPFEAMTRAWWNVYDRHYGQSEKDPPQGPPQRDSSLVQYFVKGEFKPLARDEPQSDSGQFGLEQQSHVTHPSAQAPEHLSREEHRLHRMDHRDSNETSHPPQPTEGVSCASPTTFSHDNVTQDHGHQSESQHVDRTEHPPPPPMEPVWDGSKQAPPANSKPEAPDFPDMKYEMSQDAAPFVPPVRYPSPPRDMWYEVPQQRSESLHKPEPIFPWERHQPPATRVFASDYVSPVLKVREEEPGPGLDRVTSSPRLGGVPAGPSSPVSDVPSVKLEGGDESVEVTPVGSPPQGWASPSPSPGPSDGTPPPMSDYWSSPTATNAWDEVPGIRRYIERVIDQTGLGGVRRESPALRQGLSSDRDLVRPVVGPAPTRRPRRGFFKITDFPSAEDHPSLPITPALPLTPGDAQVGGDEGGEGGWGWEQGRSLGGGEKTVMTTTPPPPPPRGPLREAEGVPRSSEWVCVHGRRWGPSDCVCDVANVLRHYKNPMEQLARLAADPEALLRRLSVEQQGVPEREVVRSAEGVLGPERRASGAVAGDRTAPAGGVVAGDRTRVAVAPEQRNKGAAWMGGAGAGVIVEKAEAPLVAPVAVKRGPADPVANLDEAASSLSGLKQGRKSDSRGGMVRKAMEGNMTTSEEGGLKGAGRVLDT